MKYSNRYMNEADLGILMKRERGYYIAFSFIVAIMLLMCLLIIPANDGWEVAAWVGAVMFVIVAAAGVLFWRLLAKTRLDRRELLKVCGDFKIDKVLDQGEYSTHWYLTVSTDQKAHKLSVKKQVYEAVFRGDIMYVEFAPNSGTLLLLKMGEKHIPLG